MLAVEYGSGSEDERPPLQRQKIARISTKPSRQPDIGKYLELQVP